MMTAIFETTSQALHVSFKIMSVEARQENHFRKALIRAIETIRDPSDEVRDWMDQLRGTSSGTINFCGLSIYEVRAQCAMVTTAVRSRLPEPEMWVVLAKYIPTEEEDLGNNRKRFYYSQERVDAIKNLSTWLVPNFPAVPSLAMDCMIAKLFANHVRIEISFRDLAHSFGGNHMTYARAFNLMKGRLRALETLAVGRLTAYFESTGLVEPGQQIA